MTWSDSLHILPPVDQQNVQVRRGDRQLMADMNRNLVLHALRNRGRASRADIARDTGLSATTVSGMTAALIDSGLVVEVGPGKLDRGRPPVVLELDSSRNYVIGVRLMSDSIIVVVTDLHGKVLYRDSGPLPGGLPPVVPGSPEAPDGTVFIEPSPVLAAICAAVRSSIRRAKVNRTKVLGVGIGIGGVFDGGVCLYSPIFGWENVAVAAPLSKRLGYPVLVENDVKTLAVAELWFGHGRGVDNFLVVIAGRGVGIGIVVNGALYRGSDGAAGEFGHVTVPGITARCRCGRIGCLEAATADYAVLREAVDDARPESPLLKLPREGITLEAVREAAEAGDPSSIRALTQAGSALGLALAAIANVLNPRLLIITGEGLAAGPLRLDAIRESLGHALVRGIGARLRIVTEPVDEFIWARGAACAMIGELFRPPIQSGRESLSESSRKELSNVI